MRKRADKQKSMTISLEAARAAAQQKRWHLILGLKPGAVAEEIRKAKRRLQLTAHTDKGGTKELSQLINHAADELLQRCPKDWIPQASEDDPEWWDQLLREAKEELERRQRMEEERAQRAARLREERRREEVQKKQRADEERRRRYEESERQWLEGQRLQRDRAHEDTVRLVGHRRTRCKSQAYLGKLAGKAFPMVQYRLRRLQEAGSTKEPRRLPMPWRPKCVHDALPGRIASPRQRDLPNEMPTKPLAWTSCGRRTKRLMTGCVTCIELASPRTLHVFVYNA